MQSREFLESRQEMETLLREETVGYLGLSVADEPYVVPLNYGYVDGRILFHCAMTGKKLDCLKQNQRVCFTVGRQSGEVRRHAQGGACHVDSDSVICHGRARIVDDLEERREVLNTFNRCFRPDADDITLEAAEGCCAVVIEVSEMTGRRERDRERTYWQYSFEE
jgi:nitroimidazol reductase NimA-like FMN-containing flavoprotein (pyridoxamine 5'-phosphate oxidase superfamily)